MNHIDLSIVLAILIGSFTFIIKDICREVIEGIWLKISGETPIGDKIRVKRRGKVLYEGTIEGFSLRNTRLRTDEDTIIFVENSKIMDYEVEHLNS